VITLLALPTIWLVNRDEAGPSSARPNVAAVGIDPGEADNAAAVSGAPASQFDPMGASGAMYLEPATSVVPLDSVVVAVGTTPDEAIATARGTYRRDGEVDACLFNGLPGGQDITVVNVANGRSVECTTALFQGDNDELTMHVSRFQKIADLTAAPIHVEIRQ
jgi:hypothetical protein